MKHLIKLFLVLSSCGIFMTSSFAEEQKIENTITYAKAKSRAYVKVESRKSRKGKSKSRGRS